MYGEIIHTYIDTVRTIGHSTYTNIFPILADGITTHKDELSSAHAEFVYVHTEFPYVRIFSPKYLLIEFL